MKPIKRFSIDDGVEVLSSALFDLPYNSYDVSCEVIEKQKELGLLKDRLQEFEDKMTISIASEVDDKGKPVFSNQNVRDAEARIRLSRVKDYQDLKKELGELSSDVEKMKNQGRAYSELFKTMQNQVYYIRRIEELDNVKEIQKNKASNVRVEE